SKWRSGGRGVTSLIESVYSIDLPYRPWALGVLQSMQKILACDLGGFACFWQASYDGLIIDSPVTLGLAAKHSPQIFAGLGNDPSHWLNRILDSLPAAGVCALTSETDPDGNLTYRSALKADGVEDGVNLIARHLNQRGFLISLGITRRHRPTVSLR